MKKVKKKRLIRPSKNLFVEMVQVYLDYKKINAKATIDKDGFLAVLVDMTTEDSKRLSDLLSKCMPISYIMVNTHED